MTKDVIKTDEVEEIVQSLDLVAGRRAFIKALGFGAIGAAVFGAAAGVATSAAAQQFSDADILNFALNLEYLEATFYNYAANGSDIPAGDTTGGAGQPAGQIVSAGTKVPFTSTLVKAYAREIASEELRHVVFLRTALGSGAVARPSLDVNAAFATAAMKAGLGAGFNAYANDTNFLLASYIFEDVGVTAYHGAAGLISNPAYLEAAAGILAVEAYHAGIIRTALFAQQSSTIVNATNNISALRSELANGAALVDDIGIGTIAQPTLVPVDAQAATMFNDIPGGDAIAYARSAKPQVLNIVYGNTSTTPGLFFPAGMNGTIR